MVINYYLNLFNEA